MRSLFLSELIGAALDNLDLVAGVAASPWHLSKVDQKMPMVNRAYNQARSELSELGILRDGQLLDRVCVYIAIPASFSAHAYVHESLTVWTRALGYKKGHIYLPSNLTHCKYQPGHTLTDIIRHEYAHTWHCRDRKYFEGSWFESSFGTCYEDETCPQAMLLSRLASNREYRKRIRNAQDESVVNEDYFRQNFVSRYARTKVYEDFAETFMYFMKYRNSLDRFKNRHGVYRKLMAVKQAVRRRASQLNLA